MLSNIEAVLCGQKIQGNQFLAAESLTLSSKCTEPDSRRVLEESLLLPLKIKFLLMNDFLFEKAQDRGLIAFLHGLHFRIVVEKWLHCFVKVSQWSWTYFSTLNWISCRFHGGKFPCTVKTSLRQYGFCCPRF